MPQFTNESNQALEWVTQKCVRSICRHVQKSAKQDHEQPYQTSNLGPTSKLV